jgi:hypothetical protein
MNKRKKKKSSRECIWIVDDDYLLFALTEVTDDDCVNIFRI